MEPKVSVVIPVYNVEKYLQSCIDSLLNQRMSEIEFIFVNDASLDHSLEILLYNEEKYPEKIRVIDSKINLCQGGARNIGIKAARGEYIGFVDSDDLSMPMQFKRLYERAIKTGVDAVFLQYASISENQNIKDFSGGGEPIIRWKNSLLELENKELDDSGRMDLMCYPIGGIYCGLWKKSIIFNNQIWFPEHLRYEDNYWGTLMKAYLTKVSFVEQIGYLYRKNPSSTVNAKNQKYHYDRLKIEKMLLEEVQERNLFYKYQTAWEYIYTFRYAFNTYWLCIDKFDKKPISLMKSLIKDLNSTFPHWRTNRYYNELTSFKWRMINNVISIWPGLMARLLPLIK